MKVRVDTFLDEFGSKFPKIKKGLSIKTAKENFLEFMKNQLEKDPDDIDTEENLICVIGNEFRTRKYQFDKKKEYKKEIEIFVTELCRKFKNLVKNIEIPTAIDDVSTLGMGTTAVKQNPLHDIIIPVPQPPQQTIKEDSYRSEEGDSSMGTKSLIKAILEHSPPENVIAAERILEDMERPPAMNPEFIKNTKE